MVIGCPRMRRSSLYAMAGGKGRRGGRDGREDGGRRGGLLLTVAAALLTYCDSGTGHELGFTCLPSDNISFSSFSWP